MIYPPRTCPECSRVYRPSRFDQGFCTKVCRDVYNRRALKRARRVYEAAYHWRCTRDNPALDLRFITREIASWRDEDRAAGRGPPPKHNHEADRGHQTQRKLGL